MNNLQGKSDPEAEFRKGRQEEDFLAAVSIVRCALSEDSAKILRYSFEHMEHESGSFQETSLGIALRNLLATRGILWEEVAVHSVWIAILQKAVEALLDS